MGQRAIHTPDFWNAPRVGLHTMDDELFDTLTQRLDIPMTTQALPSGVVGGNMTFKVPARGYVTDLLLHFNLSIVVATVSTLTARGKWPYGLIRTLTVRANNTTLVQMSGHQLETLRRIRYATADFSDIESTTVSASNGTKTVDFLVDVPLCTDPTTRRGGVFAQTDDTWLEVEIQFESQAELFDTSGGTSLTWSGNCYPNVIAWEIPQIIAPNGQRSIVLPDVSVHNILLRKQTQLTANGATKVQFDRTYGQLLRYVWNIYDASLYAWADPVSNAFGESKFQYGQNQTMRRVKPRLLRHLNAQWYRDILPYGALALDFVAENAYRDVVVPGDVMDMEVELDLSAASPAIASGDYVEAFQHALIKNEAFTEVQRVTMPDGPVSIAS